MPHAILLTGPVGSGKTTLLVAIGELLEAAGEPYALVDADWLAWLDVPGVDPRHVLLENLRSVWATFRREGVERVVLARFVRNREEADAMRAALGDVNLVVVRLDVPTAELEERLRGRDSGAELVEHLALIAEAEASGFEDAVVVGGDVRAPRDVAVDVLAAAGWLGQDA